MTTTRDELTDIVESELYNLIYGGQIGAKYVWFDDIDIPVIQTPSVLFMYRAAERADTQVIQDSKMIAWNLIYDVYCFYSGIEGRQRFKNARKYTDSVYNLLQIQHAADKRLNNNCFDIECGNTSFGQVSVDRPKEVVMTGGSIELIVQVIEIF